MKFLHDSIVHPRRVEVLRRHLLPLLPNEATVLDVGCGDGLLAKCLSDGKPGVTVQGIDVVLRPNTHVPVTVYDGMRIPFEDASFDVIMYVDVLHHAGDPLMLLREAARVASEAILIKDHIRSGMLAQTTLRFMDWVGNAHHGVPLPYNYWTRDEWDNAFFALGLSVERWIPELRLYPGPVNWVFGRSLHFVAKLSPREQP